jgi:hypothetical protein
LVLAYLLSKGEYMSLDKKRWVLAIAAALGEVLCEEGQSYDQIFAMDSNMTGRACVLAAKKLTDAHGEDDGYLVVKPTEVTPYITDAQRLLFSAFKEGRVKVTIIIDDGAVAVSTAAPAGGGCYVG